MPALPALLLALCVPATPGADTPFPGGVLDSTGRTVYLTAEGGIVAVDLAGGEIRWRSDEASVPLFVVEDRLYALATTRTSRLFVRGFDLTGRGQRVSESEPIELPSWATLENGPQRSFSFTSKRDRNHLELTWHVAAWASSPRKESSGIASIDLATGKSRQQPSTGPAVAAAPAVLDRLPVRWHSSAGGKIRAVLSEEQSGSSAYQRIRALVFRTWDERSGRQGRSIELFRGTDPQVMPDANGQRLWLRDGTPSPDGVSKDPQRWLVVEATDGHEVARVPFVPGTTSATIHDRRAYFLTIASVKTGRDQPPSKRRALVAVDLGSGKTLWRRVLR